MVVALILFCVFVTSLVSGAFGMAGGMMLMGALVSLLPVPAAIILHAVSQFFANAGRAWLNRRHIVWGPMRFYVAGMLAGIAVMAVFSPVPSKAGIFLLLGALPFVQISLLRKIRLDINEPRQGVACGFLATLVQLAGGAAGMLINVFFQQARMNRHQTVATKAALQVLAHLMRMAYFGVLAAQVRAEEGAPLSPWLLGGVIATALCGTWLSTHILDRIDEQRFQSMTQRLLLALGVACILRGLWLLQA